MQKLSQAQRILNLLRDGQWHSTIEFHEQLRIWRYGARMYDLQKKGYMFEKRHSPTHGRVIEEWRLLLSPITDNKFPFQKNKPVKQEKLFSMEPFLEMPLT